MNSSEKRANNNMRSAPTLMNNFVNKTVAKLKTRILFKSVFITVCIIGCIYQIWIIIDLYFQYPTIVIIEKKPMARLNIPGITVCNANRIKRSRLIEYDPDFNKNWTEADNQGNDFDERIIHQQLIDYNLRKMIDEMPVAQFQDYGVKVNDFIDLNYTRCASDIYHQFNPCKKIIKEITSVQETGNCFTINHKSISDDMRERAIAPGFSNIPIARGEGEALNVELSEDAMQPNEVIRLKVNFSKEEYMTLNEPVMGHIVIHDEKEVPIVRRRHFGLSPGHYYLFYLTEEVRNFLPKPYSTDCHNYDIEVNENDNQYVDKPLSKSDCAIGCMAKKSMELCNCWPPEVPFIKGQKENAPENKLEFCNWNELAYNETLIKTFHEMENKNKSTFQYCFAEHEKSCGKTCKNHCQIKSYLFNREVRTWPALERIEYSRNSEHLWQMRNCCAIISIRYWNTMRTVHQYQPKLNDIEFMSYLGGLLSMWIGFSFLGFYDILENMSKHISRHLFKQNKFSESIKGSFERHLSNNSLKKMSSETRKTSQSNARQYQKSVQKLYFR